MEEVKKPEVTGDPLAAIKNLVKGLSIKDQNQVEQLLNQSLHQTKAVAEADVQEVLAAEVSSLNEQVDYFKRRHEHAPRIPSADNNSGRTRISPPTVDSSNNEQLADPAIAQLLSAISASS